MGHLLKLNQALVQQRGDRLRQQFIQKRFLRDAEVAQRVIIERHTAGDPPISCMAFAQSRQFPALPTPSIVA